MHYVYHPKYEPKLVNTEEYQSYLCHGWYDTPAKFPKEMQKIRDLNQKNEEIVEEKKKRGRPPNDNRSSIN